MYDSQKSIDGVQQSAPGSRIANHNNDVNLLDYWRVIWKHKKSIIATVVVASIAAVIISLLLPKTYKAEAVIIPVSAKGGSGLSALASQFGGLASLAGISLPGGHGDDASKMMAILKSRTLNENVINRENMMPILFKEMRNAKSIKWKTDDPEGRPSMEEAVKRIKKAVSVTEDRKNNTIKITGVFRDPHTSARVVNAYLEELQNFINTNAFTVAKRNRIFIEDQLEQNKAELLESGKEINHFYNRNKISNVDAQVDVPLNREQSFIERESRVTGKISDDQLEEDIIKIANAGSLVSGPKTMASDATPPIEVSEVETLLAKKSELDRKIAEAKVVKNVPQQVYLTYLILRRELLAKVNALLTTQYEMAKIEEAKEELAFQVIDKAVPPIERYRPKRTQICIVTFMGSVLFAMFLAFFRDYLRRMKAAHQ